MTDNELLAFMRLGFAYQTGLGAGLCCQQQASSTDKCRKVIAEMAKFEKLATKSLRQNEEAAKASFIRQFGADDGPTRFKSSLNTYERTLAKRTSAITPEQCQNLLNFVEMASHLDEEAITTVFINLVQPHEFAPQRQKVPKCP